MSLLSLIPAPLLHLGASILSCRRKVVFEADLDRIRALPLKAPVRYRFGHVEDLPKLAVDSTFDNSARLFALERLEAGDLLVLGEIDREVVYYGWLMLCKLDLGVRRYLRLPDRTAYSYRLFTAETQRRRGLCAAYYSYAARELRAKGFNRAVSWVEARNGASIRIHQASGFREIGSIWHFRILFRSYFFVSPATRARLAGSAINSDPLPIEHTTV